MVLLQQEIQFNKNNNVKDPKVLNITQIIVNLIIPMYLNFYKELNYKVFNIFIYFHRVIKIKKRMF